MGHARNPEEQALPLTEWMNPLFITSTIRLSATKEMTLLLTTTLQINDQVCAQNRRVVLGLHQAVNSSVSQVAQYVL